MARIEAINPLARLTRACLVALGGFAIVLLGAASALGAVSWSTPTDLSSPAKGAVKPQIAVDAAGEAVAVWKYYDDHSPFLVHSVIQSASRPPGGSWSPPTTISAGGRGAFSTAPQLAVDAAGEAVVVWTQAQGGSERVVVRAASRPPGGDWSAPTTISGEGTEPLVGIGATGEAVAVWLEHQSIRAASRAPGGGWSAPSTLSRGHVEFPDLAINASGEAVAVWGLYGLPGDSTVVQAVARPPGGSWSSSTNLSKPEHEAELPQVAIDAAGEAVVVWEKGLGRAIQSVDRSPGGKWSSVRTLSVVPPRPNAINAPAAEEAQVEFGPPGMPIAVWERGNFTYGPVIQTASRAPSGIWSKPASISPRPLFGFEPQVALDAAGDAVVVWISRPASRNNFDFVVRSATRSALGGWSPTTSLSKKERSVEEPRLAVSPAGAAFAIWRTRGRHPIIQSASRP